MHNFALSAMLNYGVYIQKGEIGTFQASNPMTRDQKEFISHVRVFHEYVVNQATGSYGHQTSALCYMPAKTRKGNRKIKHTHTVNT